ncbi:MAG TPA: hypothetical protein VKU02_33495 [Gemmataceae bacterium]|nr:hypothetical protein [Gemmataceae bacterium]
MSMRTASVRLHHRPARLVLLAVVLCSAALGSLLGMQPSPTAPGTPSGDPLPIRRLLISPERLPMELQRARQGTLVQIARDDFEAHVAAAARAGEAIQHPPQLVEARYRANLIDTALVGMGQWTIVHSGAVAGILPLQPLNLALRQVRLDRTDAIVGDLDGKSLGLLVEQCGMHQVSVTWSARGDPGPAGLRFELKVPSCVLTSFELELPADRTATVVGDTCLLSGPHPASSPDQRTWRLLCGGVAPIDLLVRRVSSAGDSPPLVLARLRTKQRLAVDLLEADYEFNLDILHSGVSELVCEGDPILQPTAVSIGNAEIETWEVRRGPTPGAPFRLRILLHEALEGNLSLRVHCVAAVAPTDRWTSPALRLKGGVFQGETLLLQLAPDVRLEDWQPGGYKLLTAASEPTGGQTLTLQSGLSTGATMARPNAQIRIQEPEYRVHELLWWHIGADSAALTVQIDYEIVRGRLFRLPIVLPANWYLDHVDLHPKELLWNSTPLSGERGQTVLIVELQRALESPGTLRLTLHLRPANSWPIFSRENKAKPAAFSIPFPQVLPQRARPSAGALAIRIDPLYESTVRTAARPVPADHGSANDDPEDPQSELLESLSAFLRQPPWGAHPPDALYLFGKQPVTGTVELRSRSPRVRAHCTSEIVLASGRAAVLTRLLLQPEVGSPDTIDLLVSAPIAGPWNWRSEGGRNAVKAVQRLTNAEIVPWLLPLGAGTPLAATALLHPVINGPTWWRLTLDQPLREPLLLEATFDLAAKQSLVVPELSTSVLAGSTALDSLALAAAGFAAIHEQPEARRWEVPLLSVLSAEPMDGEVQLYLAGTGVARIETVGLGEVAAASSTGTSTPWRMFRYNRLPASLVVHSGIAAPDHRPTSAVIEQANLRTYVEPGGRLLNYYSLQLQSWKQRNLPLRLPAGAQLLAIKADGRWVANPVLHESAEEGPVVELPVAGEAATQSFEVVYALEYRAGSFWTAVCVPVPVLPVTPLAFRKTWCLPPGLLPLSSVLLLRHPGPDREFPEGAGKVLHLSLRTASSTALSSEAWRQRQDRLLADADTYLHERQRQNKDTALGDALYDLTYDLWKGKQILVVDATALHEAGLRPTTPIHANVSSRIIHATASEGEPLLRSLEGLGLVCVPCTPGPLLTTQRQWAAWRSPGGRTHWMFSSVEPAIAEAIAHGQDLSGRFQSATQWLREDHAEPATPRRPEMGNGTPASVPAVSSLSLPHPESWTEWEPIPGATGNETLVLLRPEGLWGVSYSLAGLLLLAGSWIGRRAGRLRYHFNLVWLTGSVLGLLWLPTAIRTVFWLPLCTGIAWVAVWYLVSGLRIRKPAHLPGSTAAVGLAIALTMALPGQAAAPGPYTVWLVPGPPNAPEKLNALVPPELLTQLESLASRGAAGLRGVLLLSAKYHATVENGVADFEAEFQARSFTDQPTVLSLPLGGVELREVLLDGNEAYPAALPPPQTGYSLKVQGRGVHRVRTRFAVRIGVAEDQDLRVTIPELAQSQLTLWAPPGAHYLQASSARGAQQVHLDPKGIRLDADLGRISSLVVHWRQEPEPAPAPAVQVKEAYYWDLRPAGSRLVALLDYVITRGAITELTARLPDSLEVRQVETVSTSTAGVGPRLQDWTLFGSAGQRRLRLAFQGPVTNTVQVLLELVPRRPPAQTAALSLPTPEGVSFRDGFLAYRVVGLQDSVADSRGVLGIEPAVFESQWQPAGTEYPGPPARAYHFQRAAGSEPYLRLDLHPLGSGCECVQDLTWYLSPEQANLHVRAILTAAQKDLTLVEWEVPTPVLVTDVRGTEVRSWSRSGSRLQIWLQRALAETTLEWTGSLPRPVNQPRAAFELPCLAVVGATPQTTFLRILAEKGWAVHAEHLRNLGPLPESGHSDREQGFLSRQPSYAGVFRLHPLTAAADVRTLSLIEVRDRQIVFQAMLDYEIGPRKSRTVTIHLHGWKGQGVRLDVPPNIRHRELRGDPLARTWVLELPFAWTGRLACQITGILTPDNNGLVIMPDVSVEEATSSERWLAIIGQGLRPEEQHGLVTVSGADQALGRWPAATDRLRNLANPVWKIDAADWKLHLQSDLPLVESKAAQLFLNEQAAVLRDGRRWLHESTYWLYQESGTHLGILLPAGGTLLTATLDGEEIAPLKAGAERFWLPLTGGSRLGILRLCWTSSADSERLDLLRLEEPHLENVLPPPGAIRQPTFWTVHIPPGYRLVDVGGNTDPSNAAERALRSAAAQLQATEVLAKHLAGKAEEGGGRQLLTAQVHFYRQCRDAEFELAFPGRWDRTGVDGASLAARLRKLQAENRQLSHTYHFERIRTQAETQVASGHRTDRTSDGAESNHLQGADDFYASAVPGTPTFWQVHADSSEPHLRLGGVATEQTRQAFGYSGLVLLLLLVAWLLPSCPRVLAWLWALWPEQFLMLGGLVWLARGGSLVTGLFVFLWVVARMIYWVRWVLIRFQQPAPASGANGTAAT